MHFRCAIRGARLMLHIHGESVIMGTSLNNHNNVVRAGRAPDAASRAGLDRRYEQGEIQ